MVSFLTAGSREKDTIFGAARKFFGPSYFVTALAYNIFKRLLDYFFSVTYHLKQIGGKIQILISTLLDVNSNKGTFLDLIDLY